MDVNEQQIEQWNLDPPPLYLWSRPDWTLRHKQIALEQGQLMKENHYSGGTRGNAYSNYLMEENQDWYGDFSSIADGCTDINRILEDVPNDI